MKTVRYMNPLRREFFRCIFYFNIVIFGSYFGCSTARSGVRPDCPECPPTVARECTAYRLDETPLYCVICRINGLDKPMDINEEFTAESFDKKVIIAGEAIGNKLKLEELASKRMKVRFKSGKIINVRFERGNAKRPPCK